MRHIAFLLMVSVLLAGCIQLPGQQTQKTTGPAVVNVSQNASASQVNITQTQQNATVIVNQTTNTSSTTSTTQSDALSAIPSSEISFKTKDSWIIYGTHYPSKSANPKVGIILLHQLGANRSSFDSLIPVLHEELPDADILAIDTRGHGKSTNIGTYTRFKLAGDYRAMTNDIKGARDYLAFFRNLQDFYLVGASIGSSSAISYGAEDSSIQRIVMLSPGMNYKGVDITKPLADYHKYLYIVAADQDLQSAADAKTAHTESDSDSALKKLLIYKDIGSAHGTEMLNASENSADGALDGLIAGWLK